MVVKVINFLSLCMPRNSSLSLVLPLCIEKENFDFDLGRKEVRSMFLLCFAA